MSAYRDGWRLVPLGSGPVEARYYFWPIPMYRLAKALDLYLDPPSEHRRAMRVYGWLRAQGLLRLESREVGQ